MDPLATLESYDSYLKELTVSELKEIAANINHEAFPERYNLVKKYLAKMNADMPPDGNPPLNIPPTPLLKAGPKIDPLIKYKTFWRRFFANFMDGLILGIPMAFIQSKYIISSPEPSTHFVWNLLSPLVMVFYVIMMHGTYGQTWGKMITRVIVMDISESRPIDMRQAVLRDLVPLAMHITRIVLLVILNLTTQNWHEVELFTSPILAFFLLFLGFTNFIWFLAEVITMITNKKRRAVHDYIADSVVIRN